MCNHNQTLNTWLTDQIMLKLLFTMFFEGNDLIIMLFPKCQIMKACFGRHLQTTYYVIYFGKLIEVSSLK